MCFGKRSQGMTGDLLGSRDSRVLVHVNATALSINATITPMHSGRAQVVLVMHALGPLESNIYSDD